MIALLLVLQAAAATPAPVFGPIGRQELPTAGCAAYLWSAADRNLVAMAVAAPGRLRLALDGAPAADLVQDGPPAEGSFGFAPMTAYRAGQVTATLDMTITARDDLAAGATVPQATIRLDRPGQDTVVLPVAGLIGCRTPTRG